MKQQNKIESKKREREEVVENSEEDSIGDRFLRLIADNSRKKALALIKNENRLFFEGNDFEEELNSTAKIELFFNLIKESKITQLHFDQCGFLFSNKKLFFGHMQTLSKVQKVSFVRLTNIEDLIYLLNELPIPKSVTNLIIDHNQFDALDNLKSEIKNFPEKLKTSGITTLSLKNAYILIDEGGVKNNNLEKFIKNHAGDFIFAIESTLNTNVEKLVLSNNDLFEYLDGDESFKSKFINFLKETKILFLDFSNSGFIDFLLPKQNKNESFEFLQKKTIGISVSEISNLDDPDIDRLGKMLKSARFNLCLTKGDEEENARNSTSFNKKLLTLKKLAPYRKIFFDFEKKEQEKYWLEESNKEKSKVGICFIFFNEIRKNGNYKDMKIKFSS